MAEKGNLQKSPDKMPPPLPYRPVFIPGGPRGMMSPPPGSHPAPPPHLLPFHMAPYKAGGRSDAPNLSVDRKIKLLAYISVVVLAILLLVIVIVVLTLFFQQHHDYYEQPF